MTSTSNSDRLLYRWMCAQSPLCQFHVLSWLHAISKGKYKKLSFLYSSSSLLLKMWVNPRSLEQLTVGHREEYQP